MTMNDTTVDEIRRLWFKEGWTASMIADQIGKSRNSVLGIIWRRWGKGKQSPKPRVPSATTKALRQIERAKRTYYQKNSQPLPQILPTPSLTLENPREYDANSRRLELADLRDRDCRFPVAGSGTQTLFCAHPVTLEQSSYCDHHHQRCCPGAKQIVTIKGAR